MLRRNRFTEEAQELNTTSTADISFILLIFFLMTTSMSLERGMFRKLPPAPAENEAPQVVQKENLMVVDILADHILLCNDEAVDTKALAERVADFASDEKHVISLRTADDASYEDYFAVQQLLARTARQMRKKIKISESELPQGAMQQEGGTQ